MKIYVKLNNLNPLSSENRYRISCRKPAIQGGTGIGTKNTNSMSNMLLSAGPAVLLVLFIISSGYF